MQSQTAVAIGSNIVRKGRRKRARYLFALLLLSDWLFAWELTGAKSAELKASWQADWEKTLQAATKEKQVVIYASADFEKLFREFQPKYPEIKVAFLPGSARDNTQRLIAERRAGKYLADLYIGGATTAYTVLYKGRLLDPVRPALILPEVTDESKWWEGKHRYGDDEERHVFAFNGELQPYFSYNTKLVNPKEFSSFWDFLNLKWKGKMVMFDPGLAGAAAPLRFIYHHPELGPPFLRRLLGEMEIPASRDYRLFGDWLATGKYALILFTDAQRIDLDIAKRQGLPVDWFGPNTFKEGAILGSASGNLGLINRAPHPNAARLAINWLLSREGQTAYQRIFQKPDSRRIDIPKNEVPSFSRRTEGVKYVLTDKPEWMDMKPILDLINEVRRGKK